MPIGKLYLIPVFLHEEATNTIPNYVLDAVKNCQVFFVENEKSARRFLKKIWKEMVIDDYAWFAIHKAEESVQQPFREALLSGKNVGILSEAGCPCIADPGQLLVEKAHQLNVTIQPLVGPNSLLLALMASGMNGQHFHFHGYLPIDGAERKQKIKELEQQSLKNHSTQLFIETPYRNNALVKDILASCASTTRLCMAVDLTAPTEFIATKTIHQWKTNTPDIHKRLAIFLIQA